MANNLKNVFFEKNTPTTNENKLISNKNSHQESFSDVKKNTKPRKSIGKTPENHRKTTGKQSENHRKNIGKQ